jgi:hypothetical protein
MPSQPPAICLTRQTRPLIRFAAARYDVLRHQFPSTEADRVPRKDYRDGREDHQDEIKLWDPELHDGCQNANDEGGREWQPHCRGTTPIRPESKTTP